VSESGVTERRGDAIHQIAVFSNRGWNASPTLRLSRREVQILSMLAAGHSNKGIADQAFVSKDTVKFTSRIFTGNSVYATASKRSWWLPITAF